MFSSHVKSQYNGTPKKNHSMAFKQTWLIHRFRVWNIHITNIKTFYSIWSWLSSVHFSFSQISLLPDFSVFNHFSKDSPTAISCFLHPCYMFRPQHPISAYFIWLTQHKMDHWLLLTWDRAIPRATPAIVYKFLSAHDLTISIQPLVHTFLAASATYKIIIKLYQLYIAAL